jgi:hypothetical protein
MHEEQMHTQFLLDSLKRRDNFEDLSVDGKIILSWICEVKSGGCELASSGAG